MAEEVVEQYRAVMARGTATARAQIGVDDASGRIAEEEVWPSPRERPAEAARIMPPG